MQLPAFDIQGHRGCRGLMPENTIPAMLHAIDLGVNTLEMDVVITADQEVILSHEPFFNHDITTRPDGSFITAQEERNFNIFRMTLAETRQFDVGMKPHPRFPRQQKIKVHKPMLRDLVDTVENYAKEKGKSPLFYNIETKTTPLTDGIFHPAPEQFVDLLMQVIVSKGITGRVVIQSFDFRTLQYLHKQYPQVMTAILIEDFDKRTMAQQLEALGFVPSIYSPHFSLVNAAVISTCREKGMRLIPWTVNDKPTIDRLKTMGVDGIITDYPDLF